MDLKDDLDERTSEDERAERDELHFLRRPEVRWLTPKLLAKSGVEVIVSSTFGKFADKREMQREKQGGRQDGRPPQDPPAKVDPGEFDYSAKQEIWVDYLSDTGDGWNATYTMAYLLAQDELEAAGTKLPRSDVLLLGGDQVYPSAGAEPYEDRFIGPFASAFPCSPPGRAPHMYATPGNHDWYDGLVSFLRVFCTGKRWIGGWQTRQRRSYFSIKLAHDWWIWAIDIQLDTYIDEIQLDYFRAQKLLAGDKVILLTAKPSWVKALPERLEPASWKYLSYFEDRLIRDRDARLALVLTGDLHHYARYEPGGVGAAEAPTRLTAGGGGAYLSATHTLPADFSLQSMSKQLADGSNLERSPVRYERSEIYPSAQTSRELGKGILKLRALNPKYAELMGGLYALIAFAMLASLNGSAGRLEDTTDTVTAFLSGALGALTITLAGVLFAGTLSATDIVPPPPQPGETKVEKTKGRRLAVAGLHALIHFLPIVAIVYLGIELLGPLLPAGLVWLVWVVVLAVAFGAGHVLGTNVWARFMYAIHKARDCKAQEIANQVFLGQSIPDFKSFLRMRFHRDGGLTIYALGVDAVCKRWDYQGQDGSGPRFEPRSGEVPEVRLVDGPLVFDSAGNAVRVAAEAEEPKAD